MPQTFWTNYAIAVATVALVLAGLHVLSRRIVRGRRFGSPNQRLVTVIESTMLSQHASVHVVKVGERYLVIGAASAALSTLAEIERPSTAGPSTARVRRSAQDDTALRSG